MAWLRSWCWHYRMGANTMKIKIDKPGIYELNFVEDLPVAPPVVTPEPPTVKPPEPPQPPPVEPPPPPKPDSFKEKLRHALRNPNAWTAPKEVFDFGEISGGCYIPLSKEDHLRQDRSGGSVRGLINGVNLKMKILTQDYQSMDAHLQDAKFYDGQIYCTVLSDKQLYLARLEKLSERKPYIRCFMHLNFEGAKDTSHAIEVIDHDKFNLYGRLRAVDWNTENPVLKDRRGVRLIQVRGDNYESSVLFDPAQEQEGYATNQMRYDYYSSRFLNVNGVEIIQISSFDKNAKRPPSTRPDRITGTGIIKPIFALDGKIISHTDTNVNLPLHARRSKWKEAHPYEPEVGQVYGYGMTYEDGYLTCYYSHRFDTHYLVNENTASRLPSCKIYKITTRI